MDIDRILTGGRNRIEELKKRLDRLKLHSLVTFRKIFLLQFKSGIST